LSVCLSVCRSRVSVYCDKTAAARITRFSLTIATVNVSNFSGISLMVKSKGIP